MNNNNSCFSGIASFIAFVTGSASFLANLATISSSLEYPKISLRFSWSLLPNTNWKIFFFFSDQSFAFATAVYACLAFTLIALKVSTRWLRVAFILLPVLLFPLWGITFLRSQPWPCIIVLLASEFWLAFILSFFLQELDTKAYQKKQGCLFLFIPVFCFATHVAVLNYLAFMSTLARWGTSGGLAIIVVIFFFVCTIPAENMRRKRRRDIGDHLLEILKEYQSQPDFYVTPNIPPNKLMNARSYCAVPATQKIIAIIDSTVFGSAKRAIAFTGTAIYYKLIGHNGRIEYAYFPDVEFSYGWDGLRIDGQCIIASSSSFPLPALVAICNSIKEIIESDLENNN
ncbi:MAG TPA: hypothetical protein VJX74_01885 [Blastocatellia bacterium]|nr:hypothetical protein [Blastocatellia bacterium]